VWTNRDGVTLEFGVEVTVNPSSVFTFDMLNMLIDESNQCS
jgi:hypothetical protein